MKKFTKILCLLFISTAIQAGTYSGGNGSPGTPYLIANLNDLQELSTTATDWAAGKYFLQTAGINASATSGWNSGAGFSPIGNNSTTFNGQYDGDGYTISGITINRNASYQALFGYIGGDATLLDLILTGVSITTGASGNYVGGLVGNCTSSGTKSITNCHISGSVSGFQFVGLLIGYNYCSIIQCSSSGSLTGSSTGANSNVGGLIGQHLSTTNVSKSYSTATVTTAGSCGGGFAGYIYNSSGAVGTISQCYATGNVTGGANDNIGGFVGKLWNGSISESFATGNIQSPGSYLGGFAGYLNAAATVVNYSYETGTVTGGNYRGGFIGYVNLAAITQCYSSGFVATTSGTTKGGFAASNSGGTATDCFYDVPASANATSALGTGKLHNEMKVQGTFTNWDFAAGSGKCSIQNGAYISYPYLQAFPYDTPGTTPPVLPIPGVGPFTRQS